MLLAEKPKLKKSFLKYVQFFLNDLAYPVLYILK